MEDTYNIKAIVLNRRPVGENDTRTIVYSLEAGKLQLTARGAKKIKSKLAGHLEPLNLVDIMVVRGRRHDYAGAAVSEKCYFNIKNDLAKLPLAARAVRILDKFIKSGVVDEKIFELLKDYLAALEAVKGECAIFFTFFSLKLLAALGHQPELSRCLNCAVKIQPGKNRFDLERGGLVCPKCVNLKDANQLAVSDDAIKLLRLIIKSDFGQLVKVKINNKLGNEVEKIISSFFKYSF